LIGGIGLHPGNGNRLVGGRAADVGFGDLFAAGNEPGATDTGRSLSAGRGGADRLFGRGERPSGTRVTARRSTPRPCVTKRPTSNMASLSLQLCFVVAGSPAP
jgi:hypothetical protein